MPHYPRIHRRLIAFLFDYVILFGTFALLDLLQRPLPVFHPNVIIGLALLGPVYFIVTQGLWGQTVGKRLMAIRLAQLNDGKVSWRNVLIRYSPYAMWQLIYCIGWGVSMSWLDPDIYWDALPMDRAYMVQVVAPSWLKPLPYLWPAWLLLNLAFVMKSRMNRAFHDIIAGTLVVASVPQTEVGKKLSN